MLDRSHYIYENFRGFCEFISKRLLMPKETRMRKKEKDPNLIETPPLTLNHPLAKFVGIHFNEILPVLNILRELHPEQQRAFLFPFADSASERMIEEIPLSILQKLVALHQAGKELSIESLKTEGIILFPHTMQPRPLEPQKIKKYIDEFSIEKPLGQLLGALFIYAGLTPTPNISLKAIDLKNMQHLSYGLTEYQFQGFRQQALQVLSRVLEINDKVIVEIDGQLVPAIINSWHIFQEQGQPEVREGMYRNFNLVFVTLEDGSTQQVHIKQINLLRNKDLLEKVHRFNWQQSLYPIAWLRELKQ